MWILQWLPYWIFYALFFIGVAGYVATYLLKLIPIPMLYTYKMPIQVVSIVLMIIGVYMSGAISNEEVWQTRVKELEAKIAIAQAQSAEENIKIVEKIVTKTKVIHEKGEEVVKFIEVEVAKFDDKFAEGKECAIPKEFYKALNDAVETAK